ncbi:MAG: hypothetical protein KF760_05545 [Candidatus Eremiobacteraeota bacterium]|nr:hypothetical protein [Candidatus Eremiobacteraeota bacterium]MCW5870045.1 hypothetical protein [Candidatus Eremiobacteraeota bacterium]
MELLNITSTTLSAGIALPALSLNIGNAALERLEAGNATPAWGTAQRLLAEATMHENLQRLMNLFAGLMKNDDPKPGGEVATASESAPADVKKTAKATGTGYYPDNSAMEGGYVDRQGKKLNTLQDFLAGKADYVSVAMDKNENIPYGTKLRIPELEKKYGKPIEFRVVDTGGAFTGKGTSRIDICTANEKASTDPTINGPLTLQFV